MTNSGGTDDPDPCGGRTPSPYGEAPGWPREGYGVDENGYPTYTAPTEKYPDHLRPGAYGTTPTQNPGQYGVPDPYATANPYGGAYPYGAQNPYGMGYPQQRGTNGLAIAALVVALVGGWFCGIGAVAGIILGIIALNQIKVSGQDGRGLAIAGIVIGIVMAVAMAIYVVLVIALAASGG
ncbi:MAG: DUF4190 domain-containing protein [Rhodococcus sp. (in: high G+C Gram-positive bacteria)]|uniref:DUF4190 domain-containing protein n=1 Tax=Rhodococcus sp. TaxID=1831 RepID=UPI003BAF852A